MNNSSINFWADARARAVEAMPPEERAKVQPADELSVLVTDAPNVADNGHWFITVDGRHRRPGAGMAVVGGWERFLMESGLLFEINRRVLHPFGLALAMSQDGEAVTIHGLMAVNDPEGIVFTADAFVDGAVKFSRWLEQTGLAHLEQRERGIGFSVQTNAHVLAEMREAGTATEADIDALEQARTFFDACGLTIRATYLELVPRVEETVEPTAADLLVKAIEALDAAGLVFDAANLRQARNQLMITNGLAHARASLHAVIAATHVQQPQRVAAQAALRALGAAWAVREDQ